MSAVIMVRAVTVDGVIFRARVKTKCRATQHTKREFMSFSEELKSAPKWQIIFIAFIFFAGGLSWINIYFNKKPEKEVLPEATSNQVKSAYSSDPKDEDEARKVMVGVWTYTQPIPDSIQAFPFEWIKLSINNDGTMVSYFAKPVDNGWGNGTKSTYKIITGKYADTGEQWFGISDGSTTYRYTYMNGKLFIKHPAYQSIGILERGDKNPFSK